MRESLNDEQSPATPESLPGWLTWLFAISLVYALLVGVGVVGAGFKWISGGADGAQAIFEFAGNPIAGVILGTLATALVQSSSTVTSVIVGLVAGGVPVSLAVPMIMGANMGTTITNTIVSLGNLRESGAFNKSFQAATVHDFFNLYSILIFLPIEIMFQPLEKMGGVAAGWLVGGEGASMKSANFVGAATKPVSAAIVDAFRALPDSVGATLAIVAGISLIMFSVIYLGRILRGALTGRARELLERAVGRRAETGVLSGTVVTVLVQSSSTTTSLIVPLAGAGVLTTRQVFPFTMGANIGTCITALLAATSISGANEVFALQIALVHLIYNVIGVFVFLYIPWIRDLPIRSAVWLANRAGQNRGWAFGYIFSVFFMLPGGVFGGEFMFQSREPLVIEAGESERMLECEAEIEACEMAIE